MQAALQAALAEALLPLLVGEALAKLVGDLVAVAEARVALMTVLGVPVVEASPVLVSCAARPGIGLESAPVSLGAPGVWT